VELGRSCVKKEYRTDKAISLLWEGIGKYVLDNKIKYLIGCASIPAESGPKINEIYTYLKTNHVSMKWLLDHDQSFRLILSASWIRLLHQRNCSNVCPRL